MDDCCPRLNGVDISASDFLMLMTTAAVHGSEMSLKSDSGVLLSL